MWIVKNRKIFYWISGILSVASIASFFFLPLNYSVEFTGGSVLEVTYEGEMPSQDELRDAVVGAGAREVSVRPSGSGLSVKSSPIEGEIRDSVIKSLSVSGKYKPEISSESTLGPSLGRELATRMIISFVVISLAILLFVAYAFRGVSTPVSSWVYGLTTVSALAHDVLLTAGSFVVANSFMDAPMDTLFVTALLVMLGYSVNDTIVVFDRIRERLSGLSDRERESNFETIVGESLGATVRRSISTSATVAISLVILAIFGAEVTRPFAVALAIGVVAGTYSSIFLAAPILVSWKLRQDKRELKIKS